MSRAHAPRVSVVLATNRHSTFLASALLSLSSQSWCDWELVVVADGCPDAAALEGQIAEVPNSRVIRQVHSGLGTARNVGCSVARGEFITFLDDDDWWPERRLELQLAAIEATNAIGCFGRLMYVDNDGVEFGEGPDCGTERARIAAGFHIGTLMVTRDGGSRSGWFDPLLGSAEDLDFELRLAQVGELSYVPEVLLYYRRHAANVTNRAIYSRRYGREVYEHHYRLATLRGDRTAAGAIATQSFGNARYFALESLRGAKRELLHRDPVAAVRELRDALASARVVVRSKLRSSRAHRWRAA
jgi:glycosyltransferase involved in cell wall biosynthesis